MSPGTSGQRPRVLILSRKTKPTVREDLAAQAAITIARAPLKPAAFRQAPFASAGPGPLWADAALTRVRTQLSGGAFDYVVPGSPAERPFAERVAEDNPEVIVLPSQQAAAEVLAGQEPTAAERRLTAAPLPDCLTPGRRRPLIVSLVQNSIDGDSRVQKVARSLGEAGYDSILIGRASVATPGGDYYALGPALALRVPAPWLLLADQTRRPPRGLSPTLLGYRSLKAEQAALEDLAFDLKRLPRWRRALLRRYVKLRSRLFRANLASFTVFGPRTAAHRRMVARVRRASTQMQIRTAYPAIVDIENAFGEVILELRPDAIHVHDPLLISVALRAADRLGAAGQRPVLVFDAHEWTAGIDRGHVLHAAALRREEDFHLREFDEVVTVSDVIADRMTTTFGLARRPTVVTNAPLPILDTTYRDVRTDSGISSGKKLLVYIGGISEARGLRTVIEALQHLDGVHLTLVSRSHREIQKLLAYSRQLQVRRKIHVLDYVPADFVASYLRTADIGLVPFEPHGNSDLGIPTKFREYLLARLPIVSTDVGLTADEVRRTGVGELSPAGSGEAMAAAIRTVLADRATYVSRITQELLDANSWGGQVANLVELYQQRLPVEAGRPRPGEGTRVVIGATNSAGQGHGWSRALSAAGVPARAIAMPLSDRGFSFDADVTIVRRRMELKERRARLLLNELLPVEAVILESDRGIAPLDPMRTQAAAWMHEARMLRAMGKKVALLFHGSDLRRPDAHARRHPWSPFRDPAYAELTEKLRQSTARVHAQLADWPGPILVSTPDLLRESDQATWLPVVIDVDRFAHIERQEPAARPIVLHAPTNPAMKGSRHIEPVLRRLHADGVIDLRTPSGLPHAQMPGLLAGVDIVVDQFAIGGVGVGTIEAMASGAVVVSDPGPEAAGAYGEELPMVIADPDTLELQVRALVADGGLWRELSQRGPEFARRHHDGRRSAQVIIEELNLA